MYNSRSSRYRRQVLQPEQDQIEEDSPNVDTNMAQEPEASEPTASRQATPSQLPTRRPRRRQNVEPEPEQEQENQANDTLYRKAVYEDRKCLIIFFTI